MIRTVVYIERIREALKARNLADNGLVGWGSYRKNSKNYFISLVIIFLSAFAMGFGFAVAKESYSMILIVLGSVMLLVGALMLAKCFARYSISMSNGKLILVPFKNKMDYEQGKAIPRANIKSMEVKGFFAPKLIVEFTNGSSLKLTIGGGKKDVREIAHVLLNSTAKIEESKTSADASEVKAEDVKVSSNPEAERNANKAESQSKIEPIKETKSETQEEK